MLYSSPNLFHCGESNVKSASRSRLHFVNIGFFSCVRCAVTKTSCERWNWWDSCRDVSFFCGSHFAVSIKSSVREVRVTLINSFSICPICAVPCEKYENDFVLHWSCNRNADVNETNENKIKMKRSPSVWEEQRKIGDTEGKQNKMNHLFWLDYAHCANKMNNTDNGSANWCPFIDTFVPIVQLMVHRMRINNNNNGYCVREWILVRQFRQQ